MKNKELLLKEFKEQFGEEFICKRPFELVEMDSYGNIYLCFPRCNDKSYKIGNLYQESFEEICKSKTAISFKQDILSSEYKYCDFNYCSAPSIEFQLQNIENKTLLDVIYPKELRLHIDNICDIKCFMCRKEYIVNFAKEKEFINILIPRILDMCKNAEIIFMNGNGEVFFSPLAKELILQITQKYPNIKFDFCTNGIKCTKENIKKYNLKNKIENISISLHSITEATYKKIAVGGNFSKVMKNIEYIKEKHNNGEIKNVTLNFVVCKYNYKEMIDFQKFANKNGFTTFFSICNDYGNIFENDNFDKIAVFKENHPEFPKLCKILNNEIFDSSNCIFDNYLLEIRLNLKKMQHKDNFFNKVKIYLKNFKL